MKFKSPLAIAATFAFATAAFAADVPRPPAAKAFQIGALQAWTLRDADFAIANDGKTFGVDAGAVEVGKVLASNGLATTTVPVDIDGLLVKTGDRLVLLDTGYGPGAANQLVASLKLAGFEPGQVTDILITHSHGDHVLGMTTAAKALTFPNATVHMSTKEWAWMKSQAQNADLVAAIGPKVKTFEPGSVVAPGIKAVELDGHTPGHSGYEVRSGSARLLDVGDLVHSSVVSLAKPDWAMGFDSDKDLGKTTRRAELTALAKSGELVFAPHFPFPGVGRIAVVGDGFVWKPALN
jgi:glyoxylase-like metal-dependent hydrolase (beta-lactamase superfamily II)